MTKRWYIVHAYSNFEKKVADSIREKAEQTGLSDLFDEILVPTEKVVEVRRGPQGGRRAQVLPRLRAGEDGDDGRRVSSHQEHAARNRVPRSDNRPMPISESEAQRILHQVQEGVERPKPSISFEVGEQVRVADGPFASFNGLVEEVDEERSRVKVAVSIFGRATPVELEYAQVEKL